MSSRTVATQSELAALKYALSELAENLTSHASGSLSKAHGINIVTGFVDVNGNDRTAYENSNGDLVGTHMIRFSVDGVIFYAPANLTAAAGQGGVVYVTDGNEENFDNVGSSSWVTNYAALHTEQTKAIQDDVLLPHSRLPHWEAHGGLTAYAQVTHDSAGNVVGNYVINIKLYNQIYQIPCDIRVGGPAQPIKNALVLTKLDTNHNHVQHEHDDDQNATFNYIAGVGTQPVVATWQVNNLPDGTSPSWTDVTWTDYAPAGSTDHGKQYRIESGGTVLHAKVGIGSDDAALVCTVRVKLENEAGVSYSSKGRFYANDTDGSAFSSAPSSRKTWYAPI